MNVYECVCKLRYINIYAGRAHLLHLEHMLVEVLLQLLVGQVDAKLLKVVLLELLKACKKRSRGEGRGGGTAATDGSTWAALLPG